RGNMLDCDDDGRIKEISDREGQVMRYVIAIIVSVVIISIFSILNLQIRGYKVERMNRGFAEAKERGDIPPDARIEDGAFGMEVSEIEMLAFSISGLWETFRILFIPLIVIVSLTIAWYTSKLEATVVALTKESLPENKVRPN